MRISDWSSDVCSSDLGFRYARDGQREADVVLVDLERRSAGNDENLRAGFGQALCDVRKPHVLADRNTDAYAPDVERPQQRPRRKQALSVERDVTGQLELQRDARTLAARQQRTGRTEKRRIG